MPYYFYSNSFWCVEATLVSENEFVKLETKKDYPVLSIYFADFK